MSSVIKVYCRLQSAEAGLNNSDECIKETQLDPASVPAKPTAGIPGRVADHPSMLPEMEIRSQSRPITALRSDSRSSVRKTTRKWTTTEPVNPTYSRN